MLKTVTFDKTPTHPPWITVDSNTLRYHLFFFCNPYGLGIRKSLQVDISEKISFFWGKVRGSPEILKFLLGVTPGFLRVFACAAKRRLHQFAAIGGNSNTKI